VVAVKDDFASGYLVASKFLPFVFVNKVLNEGGESVKYVHIYPICGFTAPYFDIILI
jgi:hypothetical protein